MSRDVSIEEVQHMAKLSKLQISGSEETLFRRQFGDILEHMDILAKIDTTGIEPLYSPSMQCEYTRPDRADNTRTQQQILANAPDTDGEYFIVPRIV